MKFPQKSLKYQEIASQGVLEEDIFLHQKLLFEQRMKKGSQKNRQIPKQVFRSFKRKIAQFKFNKNLLEKRKIEN
jgi:hypothetical protein